MSSCRVASHRATPGQAFRIPPHEDVSPVSLAVLKLKEMFSDHLDQGCICNVDLPVGTSKEHYETGEINFNVIFYLTQYAKYFKIESIFYFFFSFYL